MYTPVSPSVSEMEDIDATGMWGGILLGECTYGGIYLALIYSHAMRELPLEILSLCPLSVERYCLALRVDHF